jgi:hypothetical protein
MVFKVNDISRIWLAADAGLTEDCKWTASTPNYNCAYMKGMAQ